ncbi:2-hydroxy-6-oxononadienedioate/2-hydroxy-6-oxononatrienedioate hydrolase [Alphaproteobacteria bacterium SO-S41]|nr:2-hydroxy-6-oxononadienedioate/2-hydroxy-6-oxononatrienedioate hydrolase [Alphaproteobacteria bacterium SO-S41]
MLKWLGRILAALAVLLVAGGLALYEPDVPRAELVARYGGPQSHFITLTSGAVAHYRDQGPADAPVLVLLHGSNASLHTWEPWVKALAGDFRVVSVDLPGHGLTGAVPGDDYSQKGMAGFVLEFVQALKLDTFAIGGNSMGGGVAARFVIDNPGRATKLILVDSAGFPPKTPSDPGLGFRLARLPVIQNLLLVVTPRSLFAASLKTAIADDGLVTDAMVDRYWLLNRMAGTRAASLKRFQLDPDTTVQSRAGEIAIPTLILWGAKDTLIPVDAASSWQAAVKGSQLIVYPDAGHVPMEEVAETSAADAAKFLSATP